MRVTLSTQKGAALHREAREIILKQGVMTPPWDRHRSVRTGASVRGLTIDLHAYPRRYDVWFAR